MLPYVVGKASEGQEGSSSCSSFLEERPAIDCTILNSYQGKCQRRRLSTRPAEKWHHDLTSSTSSATAWTIGVPAFNNTTTIIPASQSILPSAAIVGATLVAVIVSNIVLREDIFGSSAVISSLQIIREDHQTQKLRLLLLQLSSIAGRIIQVIIAIFIAYTIVIIVYFLGYFRFEAPVVFSTQDTSSSPAAAQKKDDVKGCSDCNSNNKGEEERSLWLFDCHHNQQQYLFFPPYCAPGGLRSRIFPAAYNNNSNNNTTAAEKAAEGGISIQETVLSTENNNSTATNTTESPSYHYHTTSSSTTLNPLDYILQNPYLHPVLPTFVTSILTSYQQDWDTLGGSRCSYLRNSLLLKQKLQQQQQEKEEQKQEETETTEKEVDRSTNSSGSVSVETNKNTRVSFWGRLNQALSESLAYELNQEIDLSDQDQDQSHQSELREKEVKKREQHLDTSIIMTVTEPTTSAPTSVHPNNNEPTGDMNKVLPQAVLVYHESAHSIVFRDHLRRQQGAIRRTSSIMEQQNVKRATTATMDRRGTVSAHGGEGSGHSPLRTFHKQYSEPIVGGVVTMASRAASTIHETIQETAEETTGGYESSGSTRSNRSQRSTNSGAGAAAYTSGDEASHSSVTSGGSSLSRSSRKKYLRKAKNGLDGLKKKPPVPPPPPSSTPPPSSVSSVVIANFQPVIEPLDALELNAKHVFEPLNDPDSFPGGEDGHGLTKAEWEVVELIKNEKAVVKTIRNQDWTSFLNKFKPETEGKGEHLAAPWEQRKKDNGFEVGCGSGHPFNSFVTSTSLLPSCGKKMRCFGSSNEYATGVVFALPSSFPDDASEDDAAKRTRTWSWPSGYSAKTEFNIDHRGNLINGREEALVPLSRMRQMNHSYLHDPDHVVGGRLVKGGLQTIPYNEVYVRVGGLGRISNGIDVSSDEKCSDANGTGRSFDNGIGLPVALFVREADYGHLVSLLRTRARYSSVFGRKAAKGIPLLYITPENGVKVFTDSLQSQVLKTMAWDLNPFQNPSIAHKTSIDNTSEPHLQQKLEELLDLDDDTMKQNLTPEEMARISGGFGATDESVAQLLNDAMQRDLITDKSAGSLDDAGHNLQDLVNEGLAFSLRANDYHTSRQLLILYSLVAARKRSNSLSNPLIESDTQDGSSKPTAVASNASEDIRDATKTRHRESVALQNTMKIRHNTKELPIQGHTDELSKLYVPPPPPPPPLDTDRLRSATNSDGLLAVLGAAQVLRAMQDGSAKRRVLESIESIEEWIENGEQSVAFRVASWRDQRAAQGDLKIAMESDSNFMAFISNKAIANRKRFAEQLKDASAVTDFDSIQFLQTINSLLSQMNSPCLRLELLQYILGLDNRYSVAHVKRSVELAATCLNISSESGEVIDEKRMAQ